MSKANELGQRGLWTDAWPFMVLGSVAIVGAGLFSALTARGATYHSAWLVAYLVLIVGVAQIALGVIQSALVSAPTRPWILATEMVLFNVGSISVVAGTLLGAPWGVVIGSVLLVASLALFLWSVRTTSRRGPLLWGFRSLVVVLAVSVIVGLFFAHR